YFVPIIEIVPKFFDQMSDEDLKKEIKPDGKSEIILLIIKILRNFSLKLPNSDVAKSLELLKLKIILRLLQISPFNGKMNALNDLNKLIISFSTENQSNYSFVNNVNEFLLSSEQMAQWLIENNVLEIVLKDCLHQSQYVEKLENIIRLLIKENTLSYDYL